MIYHSFHKPAIIVLLHLLMVAFVFSVFSGSGFAQMTDQDSNAVEIDSSLINRQISSVPDSVQADSVSIWKKRYELVKKHLWIGLNVSWDYAVTEILNPEHIVKIGDGVTDFFEPHGKIIGWYPLLNFTSSARIKYGLGFFVQHDHYTSFLNGIYSNPNKYLIELKYSIGSKPTQKQGWKIHLGAVQRLDDDMWFYGIGNDPTNDSRSHFKPQSTEECGIFFQRKRQLFLIAGLSSNELTEWFYMTEYVTKYIADSDYAQNESEKLTQVFYTQYPAFNTLRHNWYSEFMFRHHHFKKSRDEIFKTGHKAEAYLGMKIGTYKAKNRIVHFGFDFIGQDLTFNNHSILRTRLVCNTIKNLNQNQEIAFYDYARHPTFRGVSPRILLRNDEIAMVPSIEHRWGLRSWLSTGIFFDRLIVGNSFSKLEWESSPWAIGSCLILHKKNNDFGRLTFVYGSEGFRIKLYFGVPTDQNDRWRWR